MSVDRLNLWFAGNTEAFELYNRISFVSHIWDDLIDKDVPVPDEHINLLVMNLLFYIPQNRIFKLYESELRPVLYASALSYVTSNDMAKSGDAHKVEIAHYLRYAISSVATLLITALNGPDKARLILADALPVMIPERLSEFVTENAHA